MAAVPDSGARPFRARNPEATKESLLTAATGEFAEHGYAGARIDRIAQAAHTNKRMIYAYFGDKDGLFDAVAHREIGDLTVAVPFDEGDLVGYAAARFDYLLANPKVRRLATWRTVERADPAPTEREAYRVQVELVARAQRAGRVSDRMPALDLFAIVLRLTESWLSASPALWSTAADPDSPARLAEHRAALITAVRTLVEP